MGTLVICIPIPSEEQREVEVEYIFGNTEINVRAKETKYQKEALSFGGIAYVLFTIVPSLTTVFC
jgi:hypothetical protein